MILSLSHLVFSLFSGVMLASAFFVAIARNPIHAMLCLILCFFNAGGLFILLGAEFLAMILVIVYGGAVAVLFLFVVMMLDVDFRAMRQGFLKYLPLGVGLCGFLMFELLAVLGSRINIGDKTREAVRSGVVQTMDSQAMKVVPELSVVDNTRALGRILYTDYLLPFEVASLVLFVATIGAIVLTHQHKKRQRIQNIDTQLDRKPEDVITLRHLETGKGTEV